MSMLIIDRLVVWTCGRIVSGKEVCRVDTHKHTHSIANQQIQVRAERERLFGDALIQTYNTSSSSSLNPCAQTLKIALHFHLFI